MDSLRYWVLEMHVDGFRFDLAATLARELHAVDRLSAFFDIIHQDPVLSQVKLIAEPWDVGPGGYQVGNFPVLWTEWNGRYRDTVRAYWRGDPGAMAELGYRLTGSSDLYGDDGRRPYASINFVTAHDGFTLTDLVSYDRKHNEMNGEENRDGESHNLSFNFGVEGPTDDPAIAREREKQKRNFLATLFLSQGVPMISGGDELGRTQLGNNNAYCQDNALSWLDWERADENLVAYVASLSRFRTEHAAFRRQHWFAEDEAIDGSTGLASLGEIAWFTPEGARMAASDWHTGAPPGIAVYLNGPEGEADSTASGEGRFVCLFNAREEARRFTLPAELTALDWSVAINSAAPASIGNRVSSVAWVEVPGWSVVVLEAP
jgi:glycogen operon protein